VHVLYVIDTWGLIGGTERHASVTVPALVERGHRITVLCREDQQPGFADVEVLALPTLEGAGMPRWARRELASRVRSVDPDVIFHSALRNVDAAETLTEIARVVRFVHARYAPSAIYITESGCATDDAPDPQGMIYDRFRQEYLRTHLAEALAARDEGIPLKGYFVWSLMDNYEWAYGTTRRFGLTRPARSGIRCLRRCDASALYRSYIYR